MPVIVLRNGWLLETDHAAYVVGATPEGWLCCAYWGPRLPTSDAYPTVPTPNDWASFTPAAHLAAQEYPAGVDAGFVEEAVRVLHEDGSRVVRPRLVGNAVDGEQVTLTLRDDLSGLQIDLVYCVLPTHDCIERHAVITNAGRQPLTLTRAFSAHLHVPLARARLTSTSGRWFNEARMHRDWLPNGTLVQESRRINSSHDQRPFLLLDGGEATETGGQVWFAGLLWSGNWKLTVEQADTGHVRANLGVNDWDFAWQLAPTESFVTPVCVIGTTSHGFGGASHLLHRYVRDQILPPQRPLKVVYNSWEATQFAIDLPSQQRLADIAAHLGVEVFVLDDGWFRGRNDDTTSLGDWQTDTTKFPDGLHPLIAHVNALGMDFGLWIEPEMISPDSDLYRAHPEWALQWPGREPVLLRQQLVLNMARNDVQDYLIELFDALLSEHAIRYIKWDMNRSAIDAGWPGAAQQQELWVRYVEGVYRVWGTLRERHPDVTWLSCSGGGGRVDYGILRLADRAQISDNTHAIEVQKMLEGFSLYVPSCALESWVTDVDAERLPLAFRFHASMGNIVCLGAHIERWDADTRSEAAELIAQYKAFRHIVQYGARHRLGSPQQDASWGVQYLSDDGREGVLLAFRAFVGPRIATPALRLRGLTPDARYRVGTYGTNTGAGWMQTDLVLPLGDFESELVPIVQLD